jgi:hypothetical protein
MFRGKCGTSWLVGQWVAPLKRYAVETSDEPLLQTYLGKGMASIPGGSCGVELNEE